MERDILKKAVGTVLDLATRKIVGCAELVHQCRWATHAEARQVLFGYIEGYCNRHRMHSALRYLTPEQAEKSMMG